MSSQPSTTHRYFIALCLSTAFTLVATALCDNYASGSTPCIAAHSTTRALYSTYTDPLYELKRRSHSTTLRIHPLTPGGIANSTDRDTFRSSGVFCVRSTGYALILPSNAPLMPLSDMSVHGITPTEDCTAVGVCAWHMTVYLQSVVSQLFPAT
ncbi:concanavalin A-like lectin/glucanase domain-containing protein [Cladorrhinum sp. PSN259]|nr:concanavalin A-like lectin/glucanase domain-containing protein [Cladorrhinum sp. PSN259]